MKGSTVTFRIPADLKGHVREESKARGMPIQRFVIEALEREVIRSARRRQAFVGIDLTKEED